MFQRDELTRAFVRAPMLRAVLPFVLGLALGRAWPVPLVPAWVVVMGLAACFAFVSFRGQHYRSRWYNGAVLALLLVAVGVLWQRLHTTELQRDDVGRFAHNATGWVVRVDELASVNERTVRAWVDVQRAIVDGEPRVAQGRMLATVMRDTTVGDPQIGDRLLVEGQAEPIDRVPDPGGFDQRQWAAGHGTFHACFAPLGHWAFLGPKADHAGFFEHARRQITGWLHRCGLPDRERALVKAILLGLRDELEPDQNQAFVQSGTIHALAVSGSHVGIIYIAVLWGLSFMGKGPWGRIARAALILAALWGYAGLTGFSPSVLRATLMFTLFTIAESTRWRAGSLNSLAAAAFLLLLWDPSMLVQLGFQLSFLAVLGIIMFYRPVHALWAPSTHVGRFFWSLLVVSLVAQVFTFPLCLYVFHAFPVWFLPANMAIVGLVGVGVYGGVLLLLFHAMPLLGSFITVAMTWLLVLLGWLSGFFSSLPVAYPAVRIGFWGMAGMYVLLAFGALWLMQGKRWARIPSLAVLAGLLLGWGWTAHQRNTQHQFAVYADRDGLACAMVQGRTMHVFTRNASPWTERSIRDHARIAGVRKVIRTDSMPAWIAQGEARYGFVQPGDVRALPQWPQVPPTLVLYGQGWLDPEALDNAPQAAWVLAADLPGSVRGSMVRWAEGQALAMHDVREAGAYVRP
jgi:competence protein ComEC